MQMSYEVAFIKTVDKLVVEQQILIFRSSTTLWIETKHQKISLNAISLHRWNLYSNKLVNVFQKNYSAQNYLHFLK